MSDNNGKSVWTIGTQSRLYYEERFGRSWRESAFLGTFRQQPHDTTITSIPLVFMLADKRNTGAYSLPATDTASPVDDWFSPAYDYGTFSLVDEGQILSNSFCVLHRRELADETYQYSLLPVSGVTAGAQEWETFDTFVDDPEIAEANIVEIGIVPGQVINAFGYAFSTMEAAEFWKSPSDFADATIYYMVKNLGVWGNPIDLPLENFEYTGVSGDQQLGFGVIIDRQNGNGYGTGIILRIGSDTPQ